MLKSEEQDCFFWFHADSLIRDDMPWDAFYDIEIMVPDIDIQQKYVSIYKAMIANQQSYEDGLEDLKLSIYVLLDKVKHSSSLKPVEELLQEVDFRNMNGGIIDVQGKNITKQFMPSGAYTNGENLRNYKVVRKGQFAFSGMQTGRDECIRIALYDGNNPIIITPACFVFHINDKSVLPEYIMV